MHSTPPALSVVITSTGDPIEGQSYSLTCTIMGAESLSSGTVDYMYRWISISTTTSSSTRNFTPLTRSDGSTYTCTVTITSPLLNNTRTATNGRTLTATHKSVHTITFMIQLSQMFTYDRYAPSALTVTMVTATSITITWTQYHYSQ